MNKSCPKRFFIGYDPGKYYQRQKHGKGIAKLYFFRSIKEWYNSVFKNMGIDFNALNFLDFIHSTSHENFQERFRKTDCWPSVRGTFFGRMFLCIPVILFRAFNET